MKALVASPPGLALVGLALGGACDPPREPEPVEARTAARGDEPAPPEAQAARQRGRLVAGERVARVPRWPGAEALATSVRERLSTAVRAEIERSPVPVLVPGDPGWQGLALSSPRGPGELGPGYALSARADGRTLVVQASRLATLVPGIGRHEGRERLRGTPGFVTENDGVKAAAWIEHGTAYTLELECEDPESPQCSVEALRAEVEGLAYVGGAGEARPPTRAQGGAIGGGR